MTVFGGAGTTGNKGSAKTKAIQRLERERRAKRNLAKVLGTHGKETDAKSAEATPSIEPKVVSPKVNEEVEPVYKRIKKATEKVYEKLEPGVNKSKRAKKKRAQQRREEIRKIK